MRGQHPESIELRSDASRTKRAAGLQKVSTVSGHDVLLVALV